MSHLSDARQLLVRTGSNLEPSTAYDTAWVAALRVPGRPAREATPRFPTTLEWLGGHQHADGSWGAPWPYYHDRLLSTLRAVLTLDGWGRRAVDRRRVERGLGYIWRNAGLLHQDPWETVGFELIFPTLLAEAERRGLALPYQAFGHVEQMRREKLAKAPLRLAYDRRAPLVVSLEGLGPDFQRELADQAQEDMGAVGISPSATAYLLQQCPDNAQALAYLVRVADSSILDGGMPAFTPIETFERSWVLFGLQQALPDLYGVLPDTTGAVLRCLATPHAAGGWAVSSAHSLQEVDSTSVTFAVLAHSGAELDPQLLYRYEEADHFRCYPYERNASISANAHVLSALHYCDQRSRTSRVEKILGFLAATRAPGGYWFDKWHVSPYYVTNRVILAAHSLAPELVTPAVDWILHTQDESGGWGYYAPTLEETAYALLSLAIWRRAGYAVPRDVIARGVDYLEERYIPGSTDYPPLWIGKTLYAPVLIVEGAVLSALLACEAAA